MKYAIPSPEKLNLACSECGHHFIYNLLPATKLNKKFRYLIKIITQTTLNTMSMACICYLGLMGIFELNIIDNNIRLKRWIPDIQTLNINQTIIDCKDDGLVDIGTQDVKATSVCRSKNPFAQSKYLTDNIDQVTFIVENHTPNIQHNLKLEITILDAQNQQLKRLNKTLKLVESIDSIEVTALVPQYQHESYTVKVLLGSTWEIYFIKALDKAIFIAESISCHLNKLLSQINSKDKL